MPVAETAAAPRPGEHNPRVTMEREVLFSDLRSRLQGFVARRVNDPHQAEDLAQEILLRVHRRIGELRDGDRLDAFAYQVARNAITDHYRSRAAAREVPAGEQLDDLAEARDEADASEQARQEIAACLRPMVEELPEPYREALKLTDLGGLSQVEAAERLGLSVPGMKARVQRGRQKLRALYVECCQVALDAGGRISGYEPKRDWRCGPDTGGSADCS